MDQLFTLCFRLASGNVIIRAWERHTTSGSHTRLDIEVRQGGPGKREYTTIFTKGSLWVGIPGHQSIDGKYAQDAVTSCVAMKPGDTDADYFADYTPEQLAWAQENGEELSMLREFRYCDEIAKSWIEGL